jgi:hypothetical protein
MIREKPATGLEVVHEGSRIVKTPFTNVIRGKSTIGLEVGHEGSRIVKPTFTGFDMS